MIMILKSVVDQYYDDICFMVGIDYTYAQVVLPRVASLRPLKYEVNLDDVSIVVIKLLFKEIEKNAKPFNTYEIGKIKMVMEMKVPMMDRKRRNDF